MPRPDFFIVGAMKCGTTALHTYLSQHPAVFMPAMKEPKFFCTDLKTTDGVYDAREYQQLFAAAPAGAISGEASAMYLYSTVAIERIMTHNPNARIIVMLRHPVEAAHSLYAVRWGYRHETAVTFEEAWRLQEARLRGEAMPPNWPDPLVFQYGAIYRYAEQARRVLQLVPEEQRRFFIYEEFFSNPQKYYAELLEFLNLTPHQPDSFRRVNTTPGARSRAIDRWMRTPPNWIKTLYSATRPIFKATGIQPTEVVRRMNKGPQKPVLDSAFRSELESFFAPDIAELERLLGRALWRKLNEA